MSRYCVYYNGSGTERAHQSIESDKEREREMLWKLANMIFINNYTDLVVTITSLVRTHTYTHIHVHANWNVSTPVPYDLISGNDQALFTAHRQHTHTHIHKYS